MTLHTSLKVRRLAPTLGLALLGLTACSAGAPERSPATTGEVSAERVRDRPYGKLPFVVLSPAEIADMKYMREEEKLARDVYLTLYGVHGLQVHANIAQSEQSHTDAVELMLEKLGIDDPVTDESEVGVFVNEDLAALYTELVDWGTESVVDALLVGATIEDLDMVDLALAIEDTDDARISDTYETLLCGSRNHLRAFVGALEGQGEVYEATFMDPDLMEEILAGDHESCG